MSRILAGSLSMGIFLAAVIGCSRSDQPESPSGGGSSSSSKPLLYAVNYPLAYFAERIGGEMVEVEFPAPPDEDPAYWRPDSATVAAYQRADQILLNGVWYAKWVDKVSLPQSKMLNSAIAFKDEFIQLEDAVEHAHGPEGEHAHEGVAFTTWLDPTLAERQAQAVHEGLARLLPDQADALSRNFESLKSDLAALDAAFVNVTKEHGRKPLLASHPVYQYFGRRYDLNLASLHWEPDQVPDEKQWAQLDRLLQDHPARWMIWEAPPRPAVAEALRQRKVICVVFYPCGNVPEEGDYLSVMQANAERLKPMFEAGHGN